MKLQDYIDKYYEGNKAEFARAQSVAPSQVTQWLNKDFVVVANNLYSYRRELVDVLKRVPK